MVRVQSSSFTDLESIEICLNFIQCSRWFAGFLLKRKRVEEQSLLLRPLIWSVILFYPVGHRYHYYTGARKVSSMVCCRTPVVLSSVFNLCIQLEQFNNFLSNFFFLSAQFLAFFPINSSHFILDIAYIKIIDYRLLKDDFLFLHQLSGKTPLIHRFVLANTTETPLTMKFETKPPFQVVSAEPPPSAKASKSQTPGTIKIKPAKTVEVSEDVHSSRRGITWVGSFSRVLHAP